MTRTVRHRGPMRHRLTGDTLARMDATVTVRELRNRGGQVLDDVQRGHTVTVTRDGEPVAQLRPVPRRGASAAELIARRRFLPQLDPVALRDDVDTIVDMRL